MSATPPRLIAVDMDGTFLDSNSEYDRDRFNRLHSRLQALNIRFVVASGNQYYQLRSFFCEHDDVLYIAENGAVIATSDSILRVTPFDQAVASAALDLVDGIPGVLSLACGRRSAYALRDGDASAIAQMRHYYHRLTLVDSWSDVHDDVVKLALACEVSMTTPLLQRLEAALPAGVVAVSSGHGSIDLISRGVNKGVALNWLGEELGIQSTEMLAFGDGGNDVEMLTLVGVGVAMANAPDSVKAHADTCTGSNDEDGVMEFVEQILTPTTHRSRRF